MNRDIENHINTYINIVSQAYDNNIRRHLNNNDEDTIRQTIQWIKSMLTQLNLTSIYDARTIVTRGEEEREMVVSLLDCMTDWKYGFKSIKAVNKIEFINGISNMILAEEEINDMTDSDLSDITNEELAEALMEELAED